MRMSVIAKAKEYLNKKPKSSDVEVFSNVLFKAKLLAGKNKNAIVAASKILWILNKEEWFIRRTFDNYLWSRGKRKNKSNLKEQKNEKDFVCFIRFIDDGCRLQQSPTNTETPEEKNTVQTPANPQTPVEDKSPYEYVKPDCVNLADYTYVVDYIFADSMNFTEWKYSNATENYLLAFEKIARVKNDNPVTRIWRCWHDTGVDFQAEKTTKYKIYVKTSVINNTENNGVIINTLNKTLAETYDGTQIKIVKKNNSLDVKFFDGSISDYVAY